MSQSQSFQAAAWRRLKKNKGAVFGLVVICLAVLVAVFAYFIAPDPSPFSNRIIVEINGQKPGFKKSFIKVRKEKEVGSTGFLKQLLSGKEDAYLYIPVDGYEMKGDSVIIRKYIDDGVNERIAIPVTQTAPAPVITQKYLLGTDKYGRDIFSRIIVGTRVSLSVGLITVVISLSIGLVLGSLAGYYRGKTDDIIMWFINVIWSIPTLLLVFAIWFAWWRG